MLYFIIFIVIFWFSYSYFLSKVNRWTFSRALKKDAYTYLPLGLLLLFQIKRFFNFGFYYQPFFEHFLTTLLVTFTVAVVVFLKFLSLEVNVSSIRLMARLDKRDIMLFPVNGLKIVLLIAFIYCIYLLNMNITQHQSIGYRSHTIQNILANIIRGSFTNTLSGFDFPSHIFSHHLYPIWFLVAPIFFIFGQNAYFLIFLQTIAIAFGSLPIYWLAKNQLKDDFIACVFALAYLFSSTIVVSNLWGISERALSTPILCFLLYFLFSNRTKAFLISVILFLLCGEAGAPLILMLGLYIIFILKKRILGVAVVFSGAGYFLLSIVVGLIVNKGFYKHAGIASQLLYMLSSPQTFKEFFLSLQPQKVLPTLLLLFQTGYLSLFEPHLLVIIVPSVIMNFMGPWAANIKTSYVWGPLVPAVIASAIFGLKKISSLRFLKNRKNIQKALAMYVFSSTLVGCVLFYPLSMYVQYKGADRFRVEQRDVQIRKLLNQIPKEATLTCTYNLLSHLSNRKQVYLMPHIFSSESQSQLNSEIRKRFNISDYKYPLTNDADYIAIDIFDDFFDLGCKNPVIQTILNYDNHGVMVFYEGLIILKKGVHRKIYDYVKEDKPLIANKKEVTFENKMRLLGYDIKEKSITPGSTIHLTYYWQCLQDTMEDYLVLTRLHRSYDNRELEYLHQPLYGVCPTSRWKKGDIIRDEFSLSLPKGMVITKRPFQLEIYLLKQTEAKTDRIISKRYLDKDLPRSVPNVVGEIYVTASF